MAEAMTFVRGKGCVALSGFVVRRAYPGFRFASPWVKTVPPLRGWPECTILEARRERMGISDTANSVAGDRHTATLGTRYFRAGVGAEAPD